jgi:hypothetical protein
MWLAGVLHIDSGQLSEPFLPPRVFFASLTEIKEDLMRGMIIGLSGLAFASLPTVAFADGNGALTGAAGGAVAGAVVGGPVGAAVGGVAGGVIGGAASGPGPGPVVVAPAPDGAPCNTRTTTTTNNNTGASMTRQTTNCPD